MIVSKKWLQMYFKDKLPEDQKLADLFTFHSFEVENIEKINLNGYEDTVFDLKVLPDRASYALCHRGIAREIHFITNSQFVNNDFPKAKISENVSKVEVETSKDALDFCKRYTAIKIEGLQNGDSPKWLSDFLITVGSRSINYIVDITNFVMLDIGQPLHAFDADKVVGKITIRKAKQDEKIELLSGVGDTSIRNEPVILSENDYVIADEEGPLALAGVKGGKRAGITKDTKNIIIESANFNASEIRKVSSRVGIRNDSSKRFENSLTSDLTEEAIVRACALLYETNPVAKFSVVTDIKNKDERKTIIKTDISYINKKLGLNMSLDDIKNILNRMEIEVVHNGEEITCHIPSYRLDISIKEDLVDEVGRIYGYDSVPVIPLSNIDLDGKTKKVNSLFYVIEAVKKALYTQGFSEAILYTLVKKGDIEVVKPLASDKKALRVNLKDSIDNIVSFNTKNADLLGLDNIKIFEVGSVFPLGVEEIKIAIGVSLVKKAGGKKAVDFINEAILAIKDSLKVKWENIEAVKNITESKGGQTAIVEMPLTGLVEEIGRKEIYSYDDILFVDTDTDTDTETNRFKVFSTEPFVVRDIALYVDNDTAPEDIANVIKDARKDDNMGGDIFHPRFIDEFIKDGKKSIAFRLIFQGQDRTLTDLEVNETMNEKIYKAVKEKGWVVR